MTHDTHIIRSWIQVTAVAKVSAEVAVDTAKMKKVIRHAVGS
jgi:hypothetical protein